MTPAAYAAVVVVLAVALDLVTGDPPNRLHPVAWMGRVLSAGRRGLCHGPAWWLLLSGGTLVVLVGAIAAASGVLVTALAFFLGPARVLIEAVVLKTTISPRGLLRAASEVGEALQRDALVEARAALGFHLVSRPTGVLSAGQVASGVVESVAENLTDALVAPVLCFVLFGLPGAFAYRALNTADTMIGYRDGPLEHFGKVAARLDDIVNFVPARLAALAVVVAAGRHARAAWTIMVHHHGRTASPNAGWTMAAMAGALGVTLEKPGAYRLGCGEAPSAEHIKRAVRIFHRASVVAVAGLLTVYLVSEIREVWQ